MVIEEKKLKMMSSIGMRASFGLNCLELIKDHSDLIVLTSDVSTSAGLDRFRKQHPKNFIDVGISEQNLIGVATGLATENFKVITTTFAPFQTLRCCEQIKVNLGYMKSKVLMVGLASGLILGNLGFSHCSIEEIGVLRSIPNLKIVTPADALELKKVLEYFLNYGDQSMYLRLTGGSNIEQIYSEDYDFTIGKAITLRQGKDICFFSCGAILKNVIKASNILEEKYKITSKIINMHTIKPIDREVILKNKNFKLHVCVEEHNTIGGLASAISEVKCQEGVFVKQVNLGVNDEYTKSGSYDYLLDHYNLSPEKIVQTIMKKLNND
tara:strand:+ start:1931 stop:2905 length:975 start_codon:yes stop_codon:yes gene_type:complete